MYRENNINKDANCVDARADLGQGQTMKQLIYLNEIVREFESLMEIAHDKLQPIVRMCPEKACGLEGQIEDEIVPLASEIRNNTNRLHMVK